MLWKGITRLYVLGHPVIALRIAVMAAIGIVGFCVTIVNSRNRWSYYVIAVCLGAYSLCTVVSSVEFISHWSSTAHQVITVVPRIESRVAIPILSVLTMFLFYRFAFGKASRSYYGIEESA